MARESGVTYKDIVRLAGEGKYALVYLLMGDEDYYIDLAAQFIMDNALKPEERDFNLDLVYAADVRAIDIVNMARQYPVMAERRVVVVREFQSLDGKEADDILTSYVKKPMPTTILVLCYKHGTLSGSKGFLSEVRKIGVVMTSSRLYDDQLPPFVTDYMRDHGLTIEPQAIQMLCEHVGSDLTRMVSEMDKLRLLLPKQETVVKASFVEELTGVSKDYNNFELQDALVNRDILKANKIVSYFSNNPRNYNITLTLAALFSFFSDVMTAYYAPEQTVDGIAQWTGKTAWVVRKSLMPAKRNYQASKVVDILSMIRETDAKSKGVGGCKTASGDLLRELVFFILH